MNAPTEPTAPQPGETAAPPEKWLVVTIHGVGEPGGIGSTVDRFSSALVNATPHAGLDFLPRGGVEVRHLPEVAGGTQPSTFPVPIRRARLTRPHPADPARTTTGEMVFAELYWADLSRTGEGMLALLGALNYVLFGTRHLVEAMIGPPEPGQPDQRGWETRILRRLLHSASYLLCCVMAAIVTVFAALLLARALVWPFYQATHSGLPSIAAALAFACVGVVGCGVAGYQGARSSEPWRSYWKCLGVVCFLALFFTFFQLPGGYGFWGRLIVLIGAAVVVLAPWLGGERDWRIVFPGVGAGVLLVCVFYHANVEAVLEPLFRPIDRVIRLKYHLQESYDQLRAGLLTESDIDAALASMPESRREVAKTMRPPYNHKQPARTFLTAPRHLAALIGWENAEHANSQKDEKVAKPESGSRTAEVLNVERWEFKDRTRRFPWLFSFLLEAALWIIGAASALLMLGLPLAALGELRGRCAQAGGSVRLKSFAAWAVLVAQAGLWSVMVPTSIALLLRVNPEFNDVAIQRDPLIAGGRLLIGHSALVVLLALVAGYVFWRRKATAGEARLIVGWQLYTVLLLSFWVGAIPLAYALIVHGCWWLEVSPFSLGAEVDGFLDWFNWTGGTDTALVGLAGLLVLLASYLVPGARIGIHIATDVISHFWPSGPTGTTFEVREKIRGRLRTILEKLLAEEQPTRLLIVAHSQGTVIAYGLLSDLPATLRLPETGFATMGSPLEHLYRHYFPLRYPTPAAGPLAAQVTGWLNLYRVDDYIGTTIAECTAPWAKDVPGHGHSFYWDQTEVARAIIDRLIV